VTSGVWGNRLLCKRELIFQASRSCRRASDPFLTHKLMATPSVKEMVSVFSSWFHLSQFWYGARGSQRALWAHAAHGAHGPSRPSGRPSGRRAAGERAPGGRPANFKCKRMVYFRDSGFQFGLFGFQMECRWNAEVLDRGTQMERRFGSLRTKQLPTSCDLTWPVGIPPLLLPRIVPSPPEVEGK